ncbi:MAG: TIGR00341 family protein [bacterium]|nr:TIGR00341 family protein [bacterium]
MSVLTVVTRKTGAVPLARLGYRIARAVEEKLVCLYVESGEASPEPISIVPGEEVPEGTSEILAEICTELARDPHLDELRVRDGGAEENERILPDPEIEVRWLRSPRRLQTVLEQVTDVEARYLVAAKQRSKEKKVPLARKLFTAAPCHTILAHLPESGDVRCRRILVPTAGGPQAAAALQLAEKLASADTGEAVALYVGSDAGELAREVGARILDKAVAEAGLTESRFVSPRVELADERLAAIQRVAGEDFDLLLLGDSDAGTVRRRLFGTLPEHLLSGERAMGVAVIRRRFKLLHRLRRRLGRWLDLTIPQMDRPHRIALYEKLQSGSEWNFDFMTLMSLSTAIAALGLLQDSGAVVIGAMLVAPLMTPILGAGLALVQGNFPLLRTSGRALVFGYLMALLIGWAMGLLFPMLELTPQLLARGEPTLLDMGVAFLSGIAAAFCLGRPGLLAALPGVAIAAALVPPIATTGVCLALGETAFARGSALLFGTNVVAIILGAAVSLYASGVRGKRGASVHQRWVLYSFLVLLLGAAGLVVPLRSGWLSLLSGGAPVEIPATLESQLAKRLAAHPEVEIDAINSRRDEDGESVVEIELTAPRPLPDELIGDLAAVARAELGENQVVRVGTRLAVEVR